MKKYLAAPLALLVGASLAPTAAANVPVGRDHWCRQGDPPIRASWRTSCSLAGGIVSAYYQHGGRLSQTWVYSPVTRRSYWITFRNCPGRYTRRDRSRSQRHPRPIQLGDVGLVARTKPAGPRAGGFARALAAPMNTKEAGLVA
jgi:hypothetical protein